MFLTASRKDAIQRPSKSDFLLPYNRDRIITGAMPKQWIFAPIFVPLLVAWQLLGLPWGIRASRARSLGHGIE
jgi:hypothetical protein